MLQLLSSSRSWPERQKNMCACGLHYHRIHVWRINQCITKASLTQNMETRTTMTKCATGKHTGSKIQLHLSLSLFWADLMVNIGALTKHCDSLANKPFVYLACHLLCRTQQCFPPVLAQMDGVRRESRPSITWLPLLRVSLMELHQYC